MFFGHISNARAPTMPRALPAALLLLLVAVSHAAVTQVVVGAGFNKVFDPVDVNITVGDTIFWSWTGFFHNVVEVSNATTCNITGLVGGPKFCSINPSDPSSCTDAEWLNATVRLSSFFLDPSPT